MQNRPQAKAIAVQRDRHDRVVKQWLMGSVIGVAALWAGSEVFADGHEAVTVSHGYTNFGELKYGPNTVLDYVNPDAPKGGEFSQRAQGTFDSFNRLN